MNTEPAVSDPDSFYAALLAAHEGRTAAESNDLNARLMFLLANQVADLGTLLDCITAAAMAR